MPIDTYVNDSGIWRKPSSIYANDGGNWRDVDKVYVNKAGTWRTVFEKAAAGNNYFYTAGGFENLTDCRKFDYSFFI